MFADGIAWLLANFSLSMFILAVIFIVIHRSVIKDRIAESEIVYRWVALFALGFTGIYAFIMHAFFPSFTAMAIGWLPSPFQFEVAVADLAFGLLGVLSFRASYGFRLATVIGGACSLWGDAILHICDILRHQNYTVGNAGPWLWMDILVPLVLIICIMKLKQTKTMAI
jgi:hypothetical protein